MRWFRFMLVMLVAVLLVACETGDNDDNGDNDNPPATEEPLDPRDLLSEAAALIRAAETIRLEVLQSGVEYRIPILLNGARTDVAFRRALVQYVAPDFLQGTVRVQAGALTLDVGVFSRGLNQWVNFVGVWIDEDFAPGFNPADLMDANSGFEAVLTTMNNLIYRGEETLEDGTRVHHITGVATGPSVSALLVGLIDPTGDVPVEVYLDAETLYPVRLIINTTLEGTEGVTVWNVDVYDINAEPGLTPPEAALAEATPEATAEATPEP